MDDGRHLLGDGQLHPVLRGQRQGAADRADALSHAVELGGRIGPGQARTHQLTGASVARQGLMRVAIQVPAGQADEVC